MTPFEADTKRDALDKAERDAARTNKGEIEQVLMDICWLSGNFSTSVRDTVPDYDGNEDLRAAEQRLRDVLRLAM